MSQSFRFFIAGLTAYLIIASLGFSQSTFGSITGTVKDPTGSLVAAAEVEVTNEGTGTTRRVTTSSAGVFNAPNLDVGSYKIRVSVLGLKVAVSRERVGPLNATFRYRRFRFPRQ